MNRPTPSPVALALAVALGAGAALPAAPAFAQQAVPISVVPISAMPISTGSSSIDGSIGVRLDVYDARSYELFWDRIEGAASYRLAVGDNVVQRTDGTSRYVSGIDLTNGFGYTLTALDRSGNAIAVQRFRVQPTAADRLVAIGDDGAGDEDAGDGAIRPGSSDLDGDIAVSVAVYDSQSFELFWERVPGTARYRLSRDGEVVQSSDGTSRYVASIDAFDDFTYTLEALDGSGDTLRAAGFTVSPSADDRLVATGPGSTPSMPGNGNGNGDGGDDGDGTSPPAGGDDSTIEQARRFGLVRVSRPDGPGDDGDVFASFVRFDRSLSADRLLEDFLPDADTCRVESDGDDSDDGDLFPGATDRPFDFASAGGNLVFTSPAGTWLTLSLIDRPGFKGYRPESRPLPTPFPSGLVVDIPGAGYPAFASVPVGDVAALAVLVPSGDEGVAADTAFRWEAGPGGDARVEIELDFDDIDDGDDIEVTCSATDDGEFSLPRNVLDALPAGAAGELDMERVAVTVRSDDDALLVVRSEGGGGL